MQTSIRRVESRENLAPRPVGERGGERRGERERRRRAFEEALRAGAGGPAADAGQERAASGRAREPEENGGRIDVVG